MDAHRERLLSELRDAVLSGGSSPQMAKTVVEANRELSLVELEALCLRHREHAEEAAKVADLVSTFNRIAAEEMEAFREEAIDIVDEMLREIAERTGVEYVPPPNPYRRSS